MSCLMTACVETMKSYEDLTKDVRKELERHVMVIMGIGMQMLHDLKKDPTNVAFTIEVVEKLLKNKVIIKEFQAMAKKLAAVMKKRDVQNRELIECFLSKCNKESLKTVQSLLSIWRIISGYMTLASTSFQKYGKHIDSLVADTEKLVKTYSKKGGAYPSRASRR